VSELDPRSVNDWAKHRLPVPSNELRDWLVRDASIPDLIAAESARRPNKVALEIAKSAITYKGLSDRVARLAGWLASQGLNRGGRVLIVGYNSLEMMLACLATMWAGGVEVVANPMSTRREISHLLDDSGARILLADRPFLDLFDEAFQDKWPSMALDESEFATALQGSPPMPAPRMSCDEPAGLQYTSGTTGKPKGALLTHANLVAYIRSVHIAWRWTDADVLLHSLPLAHGHGRNGVYTALLAGASAIVLPRTEPEEIMDGLVSQNASIFYAVPAIWDRILGSPSFDPDAFSGLRVHTSGSAALDPHLAERVENVLGELPLERYGTTETGIVTTNPLDGPRLAGTVGRVMPGAEVKVIDKHGLPVPDGEVGEITIRGPSVFTGYWQEEGGGEEPRDGWYRSGDLGTFDPSSEGYLRIVGRSREMIISGGLNVYPREVEHMALELPAVREVAVLGIPSSRWGEEVVMAVVPEDPATFDVADLVDYLRSQLAAYKVPKQVRVVEAIPRNQMGKISQKDLAPMWGNER
jgi:malonyl-CoA/methylmalonyl-CoA synthetase